MFTIAHNLFIKAGKPFVIAPLKNVMELPNSRGAVNQITQLSKQALLHHL